MEIAALNKMRETAHALGFLESRCENASRMLDKALAELEQKIKAKKLNEAKGLIAEIKLIKTYIERGPADAEASAKDSY